MKAASMRISAVFSRFLIITCALAFSAAIALGQAQATAADLTGTVVDPNGAVVPGANVTARNIGTGISRTVTSGGDGVYQLIALSPGDYEISAEAATFKKTIISPVKLTVGQSADLRIPMEIGAQNIEV